MRYKILWLFSVAMAAFGQLTPPPGGGGSGLPACTPSVTTNCLVNADSSGNVAVGTTVLVGAFTIASGAHQLPTAVGITNYFATVTDGATSSDCTTGSGTSHNLCISNGTSWQLLGGGGAGGGPTCTTTTQNYNSTGMNPAATTADVTLFALPAKALLTLVYMQTNTAFAGTSITALTASLGRTGAGNYTDYSQPYDIFAAVADTNFYSDGGAFIKQKLGHNLNLHLISTGANLSALSAGQLEITYCYTVRP